MSPSDDTFHAAVSYGFTALALIHARSKGDPEMIAWLEKGLDIAHRKLWEAENDS